MQLHRPYQIANEIIQSLIQQTNKTVHFNYLIKNKLSNYCCNESMKYGNMTVKENYRQPQLKQQWIYQKQPKALIQDNFFPTAAAIDQPSKPIEDQKKLDQVKDKKLIRNHSQVSASQVSQAKKVLKNQPPSPYEKLDLPEPEQQQGILKQLRKQVLQEQNKAAQKGNILQKSKKKQGKQAKQAKQQKISYDYSGQPIKIRTQNKNSLISGGLNGQTLKTVQKTKQVKKNSEVTQIQYERKDKRFLKVAKNNQIQFTDTKTLLSQAKVTKGIKFIQDGRIIEEKKKIISTKQLMKTLSGRKLSKQDYRKIKQVTGNVAHFDDYNNSKTLNSIPSESKNQIQQNLSQLRSASQSKLSNSILTRRKSTITVSDAQLLQNLISGVQNQGSYKLPNENIKNGQQKQQNLVKFDSNDYYNLQYMKKGGSMHNIKKSSSLANLVDVKLPKIESGKMQMPRIRQRLKDKQQIVRTIRKKFQQKLRT